MKRFTALACSLTVAATLAASFSFEAHQTGNGPHGIQAINGSQVIRVEGVPGGQRIPDAALGALAAALALARCGRSTEKALGKPRVTGR